jgi:hypothetical protein
LLAFYSIQGRVVSEAERYTNDRARFVGSGVLTPKQQGYFAEMCASPPCLGSTCTLYATNTLARVLVAHPVCLFSVCPSWRRPTGGPIALAPRSEH